MINPRLISFILLFICPKGKLGRNSLEMSNLHIYIKMICFVMRQKKQAIVSRIFFFFLWDASNNASQTVAPQLGWKLTVLLKHFIFLFQLYI